MKSWRMTGCGRQGPQGSDGAAKHGPVRNRFDNISGIAYIAAGPSKNGLRLIKVRFTAAIIDHV